MIKVEDTSSKVSGLPILQQHGKFFWYQENLYYFSTYAIPYRSERLVVLNVTTDRIEFVPNDLLVVPVGDAKLVIS